MEPHSVSRVRAERGRVVQEGSATGPIRQPDVVRVRLALILALATVAVAPGCGLTSVARRANLRVALSEQSERWGAWMRPSAPTVAVLEREGLSPHGLHHDADGDIATLAVRNAMQPEADRTLALAELNYRAGRTRMRLQTEEAGRHYRDAAAYAILALNDPEVQPLSHEQFHRAIELHNKAVDALVRSTWFERKLPGVGWGDLLGRSGITLESWNTYLNGSQIMDVSVARDYRVGDMQHRYANDGLGVPLVTHIERAEVAERPVDQRYYPNKDWTPSTALAQVAGSLRGEAWRQAPVRLALVSPFDQQTIALGGRTVGLASDRTAPLAIHQRYANVSAIARAGVLKASFGDLGREGAYLLQAYQPGKIPVLLVHGLNSSPATWTQTFNHMRNDPLIASRYQFWLYMYPTGQPVTNSASKLRHELQTMRSVFDPNHADPAWDQMVLVGHSMGGLVSKTATLTSGDHVYNGVFGIPLPQMVAAPEIKQLIADNLYFQAVPEIKRVVFIATPHRGSRTADGLPGRIATRLINRDNGLPRLMEQLKRQNPPELLRPDFRYPLLNGVGNLRYDNPLLTLINQLPTNPNVTYHSIIPQIGPVEHHLATDGIVPYTSSHVPFAESELITRGNHNTHQKPEVTLELKRILRLHLGITGGPDHLPGAIVTQRFPGDTVAASAGGDGAMLGPRPPLAAMVADVPEGNGVTLPVLPVPDPALMGTAVPDLEPAALQR